MKRLPPDLLAVAALIFALALAVWLGVAGALFDEVRAKGIWQTLQAWQGLVGALIALVAALIVVQPVRRQLSELREQNAYLKLEHLRRQGIELDREELLTLKLIKSVLTMAGQVKDFSDSRLPQNVGHAGIDVLQFRTSESQLNDAIALFMQDVGLQWGSLSQRQSRQKLIANAQTFAGHVGHVSASLAPGRRLDPQHYDRMRAELLPLTDRVNDLGGALRGAILKERGYVAAQIEALEKQLR